MKKTFQTFIAVTLVSISAASAQTNVRTINSSEMNITYMGVSELDGGSPVSEGAWALTNLTANYSAPDNLTFSPATSTNELWYNPPGGGVGSFGNKNMFALLNAQEIGTLTGTLLFEGNVTNFTLASNAAGVPYSFGAIIKDFAPDYSSVIQTILPITSAGAFQISQPLVDAPGRIVQWGLFMQGPNIWPGDTEQLANAGSVTVVPEPTTYALLGLAAVGGLIARRLRRKA